MSTELGAPSGIGPSTTSLEDRRKLDLSLVVGIAWTGGLKWLTQLLSWASTIVVARVLSREDVGIFALATLYLGLVQLVNEFGLGAAIIQRRTLTHRQISALGGLSLLLGAGFWMVSILAAAPIAWFFDEPALRWIITAMGVTFVTTGLRVLPRALLSRDLRFREVATLDALEALLTTTATLAMALAGLRYWSLALGAIVGSVGGTALAWWWRPHRVAWPGNLAALRDAITFGWHLVVSRIAWYAYSNADFAIVGRVLGTAAVGAYQIGWSLATIPVQRISALVGQVIPAVLATVQRDRPALRRYLLVLTEGIALLTFPFSAGLALVSEDLVLVALGEKWRAAILPLQLLAVYAGIRSVTAVFSHFLVAVGDSARSMRYTLLCCLVLPPLFYVGTRWGTEGVAVAWIVGYPLVQIPVFRAIFEITGTRTAQYLAAVWPALSGTAVMLLAVLGVRRLLDPALPAAAHLATDVAAGTVAYAGFVWWAHTDRVTRVWSLLRDRRQGRTP